MAEEPSSTGIDRDTAAMLCYLFMFVSGIVFYVVEHRSDYVRFHAAQSTITFGGLYLLSLLLGALSLAVFAVPVIGPPFAALLGTTSILIIPFSIGVWLFLLYQTYHGNRYRLPIVGRYADRYV